MSEERQPPSEPESESESDERTGPAPDSGRAAAARMQNQTAWVDQQIRVAMAKGEFDNLPGAGKPIKDLGTQHDPDWWLKQLIEREQVTGVLPPALQLRKDDAELDRRLDEMSAESDVRREVESFNARVIKARYTPVDGPPLVTQPRDVEATVAGWRERRAARRAGLAAQPAPKLAPKPAAKPKRRGLRRRRQP
jgi:hypothetical protein